MSGTLVEEINNQGFIGPLPYCEVRPGEKKELIKQEKYYVGTDEHGEVQRITLVDSSYLHGQQYHGKQQKYYRWNTNAVITVRRTKAGNLHLIQKQGRYTTSQLFFTKPSARYYNNEILNSMGVSPRFEELIRQYLGEIPSHRDLYPLIAPDPKTQIEDWNFFSYLPGQYRACWQNTDDLRVVVARLFGKKAVRKDMVKAVAGKSHFIIYLAWALRDSRTIPVDWLVDFLRRNNSCMQRSDFNHNNFYSLLRTTSTWTRRRLLRETITTNTFYLIHDTISIASDIKEGLPPRITSWANLHDETFRLERQKRRLRQVEDELKLEREEAKRLRDPKYQKMVQWYEEQKKRVQGTTPSGFTLEPANSPLELLDWGDEMHNCIASYSHYLHRRSGLLMKVSKQNRMIANIEITLPLYKGDEQDNATSEQPDMTLKQLLGKYNRPLPKEYRQEIKDFLAAAGVHTHGRVWE